MGSQSTFSSSVTVRAAWWSVVISSGAGSLLAHAQGKDAYLRRMADGWSDGWWAVPLAALALFGGIVGMWGCAKDESKGGRS